MSAREEYVVDHEKRLTQFWQPRNVKMEDERRLLALTEVEVPKGFARVTLNDPKVLYDTCVALISGFEPRIRLPLVTETEAQKTKKNKAERFCLGILRELDIRQASQGMDRFIHDLAYYVCSGWVVVFPHIETDGKQVTFYCDLYDPLNIYPEWGRDGLVRIVRSYYTTSAAALDICRLNGWPISFDVYDAMGNRRDYLKVTNFWEMKDGHPYNTVLIDEKIVKEETPELHYDQIPIIVRTVAGTPMGPTTTTDITWITSRGESVIASNRGIYDQANKWMSLLMQIIQDSAYPPLVDYSESGQETTDPKLIRTGSIIPRKVGQTLEVLRQTAANPEFMQLLSRLEQAKQHGGLPYVIYGGLPFEISGYALSQLLSAIRYKLSPYMAAYRQLIGDICQTFMSLYRIGDYPKISLMVESSVRVGKGETFIEEFSPKDIPDCRYVEVTVPIALPSDKAQSVLLGRQALQPPQLMSRETIWDELLDIQDSFLEKERILDDQIGELPIIKAIAAIERMRQMADNLRQVGNLNGAVLIDKYADLMEQNLLAQQTQQPEAATRQPSAPSSVMPPEQAGAVSPDMVRSMLQVAPTGEEGRPARPQQTVGR